MNEMEAPPMVNKDIMVSVIIPAYNCNSTIKSAIDSALCQSVITEIIIIDDCSTEDLSSVLAEYAGNPQIRIYRNETNLGVAGTRNRGVALATGKYVAFLDSDDIWRPDKLEKQVKLLAETGAVICSTARELMNEAGQPTGRIISVPERITYKKLLTGNVINCSSVVLRRDVAAAYPMGDDDIHEDYICWLQILEKYKEAVAVNEPLLLYRMVKNSKSGSKLHSAKMTYMVYRKLGFSNVKAVGCFTAYAFNGVKKYLF
jgi:teichuronic acid biosynthesis glycosyltransferase TuaG